ncbi:hypothetical protein HPB52_001570 [Rhipicephalus sanguineus]|uniref:Uncharacterized protein n=1 Tax=Rhipicephalus sanguineus TaxID=34632 RepID=A0A9D4SRP6_RHISA|nr:hypothetical protein HPB52_001570 [Rhipicephalus sanguineus]
MKTGKAQRSLQQQEDLPEHQTVSVNGDQPLEKAKVALPPSQVTSEPPATIAAPPKPACNTAAPAAPAAAIAPAVHRVAAKPHQRSRSGTRVVRPPFELRNHLLAQYATALRKKQDEEDYQNFVTWLAQKRATLRAATHAAHANTNTSPAQAPTASLNQLEQQAVTTIGDWLLNKAKEAAPVAADLSEPAATTPVSTDDATSSPYAAMTEDEAIDATATSPEPRTAPRPLNTMVAAPRPCPSPPPAEDDFVAVVSKAAQRRSRALETAAVATDPAVVGTVLYRPSAPGGSFIRSSRLAFASALAKRPGVLAELGGVPVTAREPADRRACTGYVYGVDGDITDAELLAGITSAVPVLSATREGATVKLRFAEPLPPELVVVACGCACGTFDRDQASARSAAVSDTLLRHACASEIAFAAAAATRRPRAASPAASTAVERIQLPIPPAPAGRRRDEWPRCWLPHLRHSLDGR